MLSDVQLSPPLLEGDRARGESSVARSPGHILVTPGEEGRVWAAAHWESRVGAMCRRQGFVSLWDIMTPSSWGLRK